jgi:hypothetical protein
MAATLMLACSNDKSGGHDGDEGVETEVNGTQLDGNTTLYGLVTDTSGNPIPGVVVSDGYGCVTTDANGVYQMERYKKARFVHYSTPAGYAINTSADNYPLFYAEIVHKNIADRHDFVLTPLPAPESDFTLVCIADPQCATTAEISRYVNETIPDVEATVDAYKAKGTPVYGITLGDIVFDTPDLWSNMKESMANRNLPVFQTIGNHDHLQTETSDDNAAANFETQFGPRNYSFNRGDVHIVSMDNVLYEGKKKVQGRHHRQAARMAAPGLVARRQGQARDLLRAHSLPRGYERDGREPRELRRRARPAGRILRGAHHDRPYALPAEIHPQA